MAPPTPLHHMPTEVLLEIAQNFSLRDLDVAARVCRRFSRVFLPELYKRDIASSNPTAILWAAEHGVLGTIKNSVVYGGDANIYHGEPETAEYLERRRQPHDEPNYPSFMDDDRPLNRVSSIVLPRARYETPLHRAAKSGHIDVAELLLDHGANINAPSYGFCDCSSAYSVGHWGFDKPRWLPLHHAICAGHLDMVKLLTPRLEGISSGMAVSYYPQHLPEFGVTAVQSAAAKGDLDILDYFLEHASPEQVQKTYFCNTDALHFASMCRNRAAIPRLIDRLVDHGFIVTSRREVPQEPQDPVFWVPRPINHIDHAYQKNNYIAVLEMLKYHDGDTSNITERDSCSSAADACIYLDILITFHDWNRLAYPDERRYKGWEADRRVLVEHLIRKIRCKDMTSMETHANCTPRGLIFAACGKYFSEAVECLLQAGVPVERTSETTGHSLLITCARPEPWVIPEEERFQLATLKVLVRAGADFTKASPEGQIPLFYYLSRLQPVEDIDTAFGFTMPEYTEVCTTLVQETAKAGPTYISPVISWAMDLARSTRKPRNFRPLIAILRNISVDTLGMPILKEVLKWVKKPSFYRHTGHLHFSLVRFCKSNGLHDELTTVTDSHLAMLSRSMLGEKISQIAFSDITEDELEERFIALFHEWRTIAAILMAADWSTGTIKTGKGVLTINTLLAICWAFKRPILVSEILNWRSIKCPDAGWPDGWIFDIDSHPTLVHLVVETYHHWGLVQADEMELEEDPLSLEMEMKKLKGPIPNIDMVDRFGNTSINLAVHLGTLSIARILLREGAYPHYNARKFIGDRPPPNLPRLGVSMRFDMTTDAAFANAAYERLRTLQPTRTDKRIRGSAYEMAVSKGYTRLAEEMLRLFPLPEAMGGEAGLVQERGGVVTDVPLSDSESTDVLTSYNTYSSFLWTQYCCFGDDRDVENLARVIGP
ncbi:hypothetical protein B0T22DRAFT_472754 [Podospora appendiculata]|uniref:F-box domain-containing protein n=1 Tax=Podospora appendiculata TaxID=314037 RepID=A0AAE0X033_9PEZI|nr:hypothetical protein B0T22DRAFT_472754 [Podospora appendiculata]